MSQITDPITCGPMERIGGLPKPEWPIGSATIFAQLPVRWNGVKECCDQRRVDEECSQAFNDWIDGQLALIPDRPNWRARTSVATGVCHKIKGTFTPRTCNSEITLEASLIIYANE